MTRIALKPDKLALLILNNGLAEHIESLLSLASFAFPNESRPLDAVGRLMRSPKHVSILVCVARRMLLQLFPSARLEEDLTLILESGPALTLV
jgi:hypothetical protein